MASPLGKTTACCQSGSSSLDFSAKASNAEVALAVEWDVNEDLGEEKRKSSEARIRADVLNPMDAIAESCIAAAKDDKLAHSPSNLQSKIVEKVEVAETEIMRDKTTYARNDVLIYILLQFYAVSVPVIVAGILSLQHLERSKGRASGCSTFILSGLVSGLIVVALILSVFDQFRALKHGRQLQQHRDSDIDGLFPKEETSATKRRRFPNYGKDIFEETSAYYWGAPKAKDTFTYYWYWWGSRAAFLVILISISACVMVISYSHAYI